MKIRVLSFLFAAAAALYMDALIAPLAQDLAVGAGEHVRLARADADRIGAVGREYGAVMAVRSAARSEAAATYDHGVPGFAVMPFAVKNIGLGRRAAAFGNNIVVWLR